MFGVGLVTEIWIFQMFSITNIAKGIFDIVASTFLTITSLFSMDTRRASEYRDAYDGMQICVRKGAASGNVTMTTLVLSKKVMHDSQIG